MTKKLETFGGDHIREVLAKASALAIQSREPVAFDFNDRSFIVEARESYESARARAELDFGYPILTAEAEHEKLTADMEKTKREEEAAISAAKVPTEKELREAEVPWLKTPEELTGYIDTLVNRPHDYGTCVYAMSMAATAAFHYVASVLGVTGFQASCADMDILRRTRRMKGPFLLTNGEDLLYPQYDVREKLDKFVASAKPWLADEAKKKLADESNRQAHPNVRSHWQTLATSR